MKVINKHIILFIFIGSFGCLEPFDPDIPSSDQVFLVVDGIITDLAGPYTVKITKSSSLDAENVFVSGASVSIEEMNGPSELLFETGMGIYDTNLLQGEIGKSYRLNIDYQGQQYQSTWERIHASPAIDSIYYHVENRGTTDKERDLEGVQFFVDSHGPDDGSRYFRYEWEETWKLGVFWPSYYNYVGNGVIENTSNPLHTCWKSSTSASINIATTNGLGENVLSGHQLGFLTGDDERFTERYSVLVKQYALPENEYLFWKKLEESNEELGNFFDKQPSNVLGNITNINNPEEAVLGYFSASGAQEERIYLRTKDVTNTLSKRPMCGQLDSLIMTELGDAYEQAIINGLEVGKFFYNFIYPPTSPFPIGVLLSTPQCSDCTSKGGDLAKPEFWDD